MATDYKDVSHVVKETLRLIGVDEDFQFLIGEFQKHPEAPSLLSVSDVLTGIGILNEALRVPSESLVECKFPLIAQTKNYDQKFIVISSISNNTVYFSFRNKQRNMPISKFTDIFIGVVISILGQDSISEPKAEPVVKQFNWAFKAAQILLVISGLSLAITYSYKNFNVNYFTLLIITLMGFLVTLELVLKPFRVTEGFLDKLCKLNVQHDCKTTIESKYAQLTNWLSLSELAFFFFSGSLLVLLSDMAMSQYISLLEALSILSVPFLFYSVLIQGFIKRSWCLVCCLLVGIFTLEVVFFIAVVSPVFTLSCKPLLIFCLPALLWLSLKPFFQKVKFYRESIKNHNKIKLHRDSFENIFYNDSTMNFSDIGVIIGDKSSQTCLTIVTSPVCAPCKEVHLEFEQWLRWNKNLKIQLIFYADIENQSLKFKVVRHLVAMARDQSENVYEALTSWFSNTNQSVEDWKERYPTEYIKDDLLKIEEQQKWCKTNKISGTPTVFLNQVRLPRIYQFKDLKYLLYK
ncbi:vitamin K epoxide reductase family protein [Mucilaginibacter sp. AW1-3]